MSWLVTIAASILGSLVAGIGMFGIASLCVKWYQVSSFEGWSGYFMVGLALLGAAGGFVVSMIAARIAYDQIGPAPLTQIGVALAAVAVGLAITLAISYLGADHEPDLGGQGIVILWEIRLPAEASNDNEQQGDPHKWPKEKLKLQLVSVANQISVGSGEAEFERDAFRQEQGHWILPARVPLFTSKGDLCVNLTLNDHDDGFWPRMRPTPSPEYFEWSAWARTNQGNDKPIDDSSVMYRFKFIKSPN